MNRTTTTIKSLWLLSILTLILFAAVPGASAQTPPAEKIENIEKQIQVLKQAVDELRRAPEPASARQSNADAPPAAAAASTNRTAARSSRPAPAPETPAADAPAASRTASSPPNRQPNDAIARIRDEGLNRSQVMQTLSYLTDVIGPRLTGSPGLKRANEWTRDKLASWGLTNAHLEAWGFGRGWSLKRFSAQIVEPQAIPLVGYPNAWSPGFEQPISGEVVYFDARTDSDLEKYKGNLKGAIVLVGPVRELKARFEPLALRMPETNLLQMANASAPRTFTGRFNPPTVAQGRSGRGSGRGGALPSSSNDETAPGTNVTRSASAPGARGGPRGRPQSAARFLSFLLREGAALVVNPSPQGDGGTFFVAAATVPPPESRDTNNPARFFQRLSPWATNAPTLLPQITLASEDYNRLVRMIQQGEKLKMAVDLQVQFHNDDSMAYNTVAEIPGTDLKKEIVMLGGHIDSWHAGTGATDDGAGVAATMEAVRILQALELKPRRTIRIGLWSGEEQGLLGSRAYVSNHFGYYSRGTNASAGAARSPRDQSNDPPTTQSASSNSSPTRKLVRKREYERFSAYFNLDNGAGKIRGVYLQGNEALRPIFRRWLEPFRDLDAETITLSNTGGTDHQSFDGIGLPGFQFIQDPIEYWSRTHHSNADVYERVPPDDLKQASVILAAFAYNAAMMDERLPRKPTD